MGIYFKQGVILLNGAAKETARPCTYLIRESGSG